jgi:hypothetical protein
MYRWHWFQITAYSILVLFFSIMCYVTYVAYTRPSGSTGQDMAHIQKVRYQEQQRAAKAL